MKKEKDAIKNSTKELTKVELVHMFKDAPLSLKFYQLAEAQYKFLFANESTKQNLRHSENQD